MVLCGVTGRIINTFWKECCSCIQRKFVFVQEWKRWAGVSGSSSQKEQSGDNFSPDSQIISLRYKILWNNLFWNMQRFVLNVTCRGKVYIYLSIPVQGFEI